MTLYAGEEFRITATATDFDLTSLTDDSVNSVSIQIFNADAEEIVDTVMVWDEDEGMWVYLWDTTGLDAGGYRYKITVTGADGKSSWEWKRARLSRNPF